MACACCKLKDVGEKLHRMIFLLGDGNLTAIACGFAMLHLILFQLRSILQGSCWMGYVTSRTQPLLIFSIDRKLAETACKG